MRPQPVTGLAIALGVVAVISACQFNEIVVPPGDSTPIVHGVLNPARQDQVILLERLLTGGVDIPDIRYLRTDPIVTGSGDPIRDARVVVYGPTGDSAVAIEDVRVRTDKRGAGVYRFKNGAGAGELAVLPGATYRLRITTPAGAIVTASTTIPGAAVVSNQVVGRTMNRDVDTLHLFWDAVPGTSRYLVHVDGPNGPLSLFTSELEARLPGTIRSIFQETFPLLFIPGFRHRVDVAAIDANYYDYYRSGNDPFTGTGLINHVEGGMGFFGSLAELYAYSVLVSANFTLPIEGEYGLFGPATGRIVPATMTLYVIAREGNRLALTGSYPIPDGSASLVGTVDGNTFTIAFLESETELSDTTVVYSGGIVGDSLVGTARSGSFVQSIKYGKKKLF